MAYKMFLYEKFKYNIEMLAGMQIRIDRMRIRILSGSNSGSLTIKIKSPNFSKHIYSISLIFKSKYFLIFKSEPKP